MAEAVSTVLEQIEYVSIERAIPMRRVWAMPNACTFDIPPIRALVKTYLMKSRISVDPFARNKRWATHTNDLNSNTAAEHHQQAVDFLTTMDARNVRCDLVLFDPPYSPRQVKECYEGTGLTFGREDAWITAAWSPERDAIHRILESNGHVISFGWNSMGMGPKRGYRIVEMLIVAHGAAANDTIVTVEQKIDSGQMELSL
jgi:hypothetical protein